MRRMGAVLVTAVVLVTPAAAEPDGSLLAVSANGNELVALSPAGEVSARLLEAPRMSLVDATWSPDGTRIAFTSQPPGGSGREVYVLDADGTDLRAVTADSNADRYNTLPLWIFGNIRLGQQLPEVNVIVLIVIVATISPVWISQRLTSESGILRQQ